MTNPNQYTPWPEERTEAFRKRCLETADSYTIVGLAFGMTRNAAIGKARRMGIDQLRPNHRPGGCQKRDPSLVPPAPKRQYNNGKRRTTPFRQPPDLRVVHPQYDEYPPMPECLMIDLLELRSDNCHWPVGDAPPQKFCGLPRGKHPSYCAHHEAIGTRPNSGRRR